jgi:hypothetical protein
MRYGRFIAHVQISHFPANFEASIFIFRRAVVLGAYHHSKQAGISPNASTHARTRKNEVFSAYLNGHLKYISAVNIWEYGEAGHVTFYPGYRCVALFAFPAT